MSNIVNLMDRLKQKSLNEKVVDLAVKVKNLIEESYVGTCLEVLFRGWTHQPGISDIDEKRWPLISIGSDFKLLESEKEAVFNFTLSTYLRPVMAPNYGQQSHLQFFSIKVSILEQNDTFPERPQMDVQLVMQMMTDMLTLTLIRRLTASPCP